jgi:D-glycero-beta-D-manno-heptose-7-phosphate kinase
MLTKECAERLLQAFKPIRILVVGDLMLDRYVFGSVDRISPEAPVPVLHVRRDESRPGGASNVALNIQSLGAHGIVCGVTGVDAAGVELKRVLADAGLQTDGIVESALVQTTVKTRVIADRQQVVRVDRESSPDGFGAIGDVLHARVAELVANVDAVLIEDYGKGVVTQSVVDLVLAAASRAGIPAGFDPKDNHRLDIPWITVASPNYREACLAAGVPELPLERELDAAARQSLRETGAILSKRWGTSCLMITLGPRGVYVQSRDGLEQLLPTQAREVYDVSGAGDTFISVAVLSLAAGASHVEAAQMANHAAGVVVGKVGTATCTAEELLESVAMAGQGVAGCV